MAKPKREREDAEMLSRVGGNDSGGDGMKWMKAEDVFDDSVWDGSKPCAGVKSHPNRGFRINGEVNGTSGINSINVPSLQASMPLVGSKTETYNANALFTPSAEGSIRLNDNMFIDPQTVQSTVPSSKSSSPRSTTPPVSYTNDPSSTEILRSLPFRPADIAFTFPSYTNFPGSTGTYITRLNNIVTLHNVLANAMLRHHELKYLAQELNSPEAVTKLEHGYVVLRAGIGAVIRDRVREMFGAAAQNDWGFTTETRAFLKDMFESKELGTAVRSGQRGISGLPATTGYAEEGLAHRRVPVRNEDDNNNNIIGYERGEVVAGRGKLSAIEEAMVARASRVPVGGVNGWWAERKLERLPVTAMRVWVGAREVERGRKARSEGRYYGWEGWDEEVWEDIGGGGGDE